jgi:fibronectin type 3 domain-containing protein
MLGKKITLCVLLCAALLAACDPLEGVIEAPLEGGSGEISSFPEPPRKVIVIVGSEVSVYWGHVEGATGYKVYRSEYPEGPYEFIATGDSSRYYTDWDGSPGTTYYYKVRALQDTEEGELSSNSEAAIIPAPDTSTPFSISASFNTYATDFSVGVSWAGNIIKPTGYNVYRSEYPEGPYERIATGEFSNSSSYVDSGVLPSTTYYYKVSVLKGTWESGRSDYAAVTTPAFVPPVPSLTVLSSTAIMVSWNCNSVSFPAFPTGYNVYRSTNSSGAYSFVAAVESSTDSSSYTDYTDSGLTPGTSYYYKLSAFRGTWEGERSDYTGAKTSAVNPSLSAPTGVSAAATSAVGIRVSWNSVGSASEYNTYNIYCSTSPGGPYAYRGSSLNSTTTYYWDYGLQPDTTYYYKVSAYNDSGEGGLSSAVSATTSLTAGQWYNAELSSGVDTHSYYFYAESGTTYRVWWNGRGGGDGTKTGFIRVSGFYGSDGGAIWAAWLDETGSGYTVGKTITVSSPGYIILEVYADFYNSSSAGTYAIVYSTGNSKP